MTTDRALASNTEYRNLVTKRAVLKRKITLTFQQISKEESAFGYESSIKVIENHLKDIQVLDEQVNTLICSITNDENIPDDCVNELEHQSNYSVSVNKQLA